MARPIGPRGKESRRRGRDLMHFSGVRPAGSKFQEGKPPGQHGARAGRKTDYAVQLDEKQVLKSMYGVLERQFLRYFKLASRMKGSTGENLLNILESRLDNVVYRMGFGATRRESRQLVNHKGVLVNGISVDIPSYMVSPKDEVSIAPHATKQERIKFALEMAKNRTDSPWVEVDADKLKGVYARHPDRSELPSSINEQLVVELYSK